jgi:DNA processing protein
MISDNAINMLIAKTYKGVSNAWIIKHLKGHESVNDIMSLLNKNVEENGRITPDDFRKKKLKKIR